MAVSRSAICKRKQIHAVFNLLIYQLQIIFPKLLPDVSRPDQYGGNNQIDNIVNP